jgi:hypothetical protein
MKKTFGFFALFMTIATLSSATVMADISLGVGDSITLGGQTVTCGGSVSQPAPQPVVLSNRYCRCENRVVGSELVQIFVYSDGSQTSNEVNLYYSELQCQNALQNSSLCRL